MGKRLAIARDISADERTGFAKKWNSVVGL